MVQGVGIVRTPIGNLQSVWNAIYHIGFDPVWVDDEKAMDGVSHLILPGVGQFAAFMRALEESGLSTYIKSFSATGGPLLGICVGMQALANWGIEGGATLGLGIIDGFIGAMSDCLVLPHVGWNSVEVRREHPVFDGIKSGVDFYFTHSYEFIPSHKLESEPYSILAKTDYGGGFTSVVAQDNVVGVQFHPEKSQKNGLKLLENFCNWDGKC